MSKNFSEFQQQASPASTVFIVGYDPATNAEVRVPLSAVAGVPGPAGDGVQIQYSTDGSKWHAIYASGDIYMRIKVGSASWGAAIPIGAAMIVHNNIPQVGTPGSGQIILSTPTGLSRMTVADLRNALEISASVRQEIGLDGVQDGSNNVFNAMSLFVGETGALFLNGQRLYRGYDYLESNGRTITFLQYYPKQTDRLMFEAILK